ncbi:hypothetical protein [Alicyclobacillus shizuokensis]|uniref:hypothetical protein n=1 Tax=Alicyclobacillus shizuokensis TaxID=392014 RepID=UPI000836AD0F|nr:hypothetical protein [Alicyclobacillus shizuokensis]
MRNVLVFPDGKEQDFMYPANRDVEVGTPLQVEMADGSVHILHVTEIIREDRKILYKLSY